MRVSCHFKPDLNAKKKPLADLVEEDPFIEQLRRQKESNRTQEGEEVFTLGEGGSVSQKKNRIQMQVKRLIEDQQSFESMKEHTKKLKE